MEIHNISEDIVFSSVQKIFESIKAEENKDKLCLCDQCKLDTICYVLNRVQPRYVVSNRGITRIEHDWAGRQQTEADIATLVYRGLRKVNHNRRPTTVHETADPGIKMEGPFFNIPTMVGRLFDGETFAPLSGVTVTLHSKGEKVPMRNTNWQNPYTLVEKTPGSYTFWPVPILAESADLRHIFEYSLKIESTDHESLVHFFKVPLISTINNSEIAHGKTFKIPDLYLFPPGETEQNW